MSGIFNKRGQAPFMDLKMCCEYIWLLFCLKVSFLHVESLRFGAVAPTFAIRCGKWSTAGRSEFQICSLLLIIRMLGL